jgi:hypothetical protein
VTRLTGDFPRYLTDAAADADALNLSLAELFTERLGVDEALLRMKQGLQELIRALGENRGAWSVNTTAGVAHRQAILDQIAATQYWRDSMHESGVSIPDANAAYQTEIGKIIEIGVQAGLSRSVLEKLVGPYQIAEHGMSPKDAE